MSGTAPHPKTWIIEQAKLVSYLLNLNHKKGRGKAILLIQFGFDPADTEPLADAIVAHAVMHGPGQRMIPAVGLPRAIVEGAMECPDGRLLNVRTVWEQTTDTEVRFVTLVPLPA